MVFRAQDCVSINLSHVLGNEILWHDRTFRYSRNYCQISQITSIVTFVFNFQQTVFFIQISLFSRIGTVEVQDAIFAQFVSGEQTVVSCLVEVQGKSGCSGFIHHVFSLDQAGSIDDTCFIVIIRCHQSEIVSTVYMVHFFQIERTAVFFVGYDHQFRTVHLRYGHILVVVIQLVGIVHADVISAFQECIVHTIFNSILGYIFENELSALACGGTQDRVISATDLDSDIAGYVQIVECEQRVCVRRESFRDITAVVQFCNRSQLDRLIYANTLIVVISHEEDHCSIFCNIQHPISTVVQESCAFLVHDGR